MRSNIEALGRGPDLVLLHGWGMHSGVFRAQAQELARRFRVHLVDLPGHGGSHDCDRFDEVVPLLSQQVSESLAVVGWSLGALIALEWARSVPNQVKKLVLVGATPCFTGRAGWDYGWAAQRIEAFERALDRDAVRTLERFVALQTRGEPRERLRELRRIVLAAKPPSLASLKAGLDVLKSTDLRDALSGISQPALVIHGDSDAVVPLAAAKFLASTLPHARLVSFPGCGHAPFLSGFERFVTKLGEFFDD